VTNNVQRSMAKKLQTLNINFRESQRAYMTRLQVRAIYLLGPASQSHREISRGRGSPDDQLS
jgi:hypothetical protein